jgi:hypothetical protein
VRDCVYCKTRLRHEDLLREESQRMERARLEVGLEGVCFRYLTCPRCGHDHVFLEIVELPGEDRQEVHDRREAIARAVEGVEAMRTTVLVVEHGL